MDISLNTIGISHVFCLINSKTSHNEASILYVELHRAWALQSPWTGTPAFSFVAALTLLVSWSFISNTMSSNQTLSLLQDKPPFPSPGIWAGYCTKLKRNEYYSSSNPLYLWIRVLQSVLHKYLGISEIIFKLKITIFLKKRKHQRSHQFSFPNIAFAVIALRCPQKTDNCVSF